MSLIAPTVSATFTVLTLFCGLTTTEAVEPGEASGPTRCQGRLHPFAPIQIVLAIGAIAAIWRGGPGIAFAIGLASLPLDAMFIASGGFFTLVPGLLVFAAGIVAREGNRGPTVPRRTTESAGPPMP